MKNFDKEKEGEGEEPGYVPSREKYRTQRKEHTFTVQSEFTYDRKYYTGEKITLSDPVVIQDLLDKRFIK